MNKGTYCLVMKLDKDSAIKIGRRSALTFSKGYYCYVGSAMSNLDKRIDRHMSHKKRFHWHIDWFLKHADIVDVKRIESDKRLECVLSSEIASLSHGFIMKGFGSSDCPCETHLHFFKNKPSRQLDKLFQKWKG